MHRLHHGDHHQHHESHSHSSPPNDDNLVDKLGREVYLFGNSTVSGAMKAAETRWKHDPAGVCLEAGTAAVSGIALGVAAEAAPVVAAGLGILGTANYVWGALNPATHLERNKAFNAAWNGVWNSDNKATMNYYTRKLEKQVGGDVFDFGLCTGFGTAGFGCAEIGLRSGIASQFHPQLRPTPSPVENPLNVMMRRIQINGSDSSGMEDFIDGDSHGLDRGRLSLHPERLMAYENAARIPNPDGRLGLRYYVHPVEHVLPISRF